MPSILSTTLLALASVASVSAHGTVQALNIDGKYETGWLLQYAYQTPQPQSFGWSETALDNGFVPSSDVATPDVICHKGAKNAALSANVTAGSPLGIVWTKWPDSHKGAIMTYLADCKGDCATVDKTTLEFFKIDEKGLTGKSWASDEMIANNSTWNVVIPTSIKAGNYVLRHDTISLHSAGSPGGAQIYPFCLNLAVTSSGTDTPTGTLGTALYKEDDPGITVNIYVDNLNYVIPGPALYKAGGSGTTPGSGSPPPPGSTPSMTPPSPSNPAAVPSSVPSTAPSAVPSTPPTTADEDDSC